MSSHQRALAAIDQLEQAMQLMVFTEPQGLFSLDMVYRRTLDSMRALVRLHEQVALRQQATEKVSIPLDRAPRHLGGLLGAEVDHALTALGVQTEPDTKETS